MKDSAFFDLDGTLTDPMIGITSSIQYALKKLGADIPGKNKLKWCIGPPLLGSFEVLVGKEHASKALDYYRERFAEVGWHENVVYPGVLETLAILVESGLTLYVATSKPSIYARKIIDHFDLAKYFCEIFGSELDGARSDKAELLRFALRETRSTRASTMIGDREHDVSGALNNNMRTIGVTYGYGSRAELKEAGAHEIVDRPEDLLPLLL